ncbi:MAG: DUF2213 domain-containing protein [Cypionkella sp.]|nr:DUF2213 domain-containing protein [Cypionkella sp.]
MVGAENWRDLAVGVMGGKVVRDGEHVVASMAIMDAKAADEVEGGARSLSAGYTSQITSDSGVSPDGTPYQYKQGGPLRFNHVAYRRTITLAQEIPASETPRINGAQAPVTIADMKGANMPDALRKIMVDGAAGSK